MVVVAAVAISKRLDARRTFHFVKGKGWGGERLRVLMGVSRALVLTEKGAKVICCEEISRSRAHVRNRGCRRRARRDRATDNKEMREMGREVVKLHWRSCERWHLLSGGRSARVCVHMCVWEFGGSSFICLHLSA